MHASLLDHLAAFEKARCCPSPGDGQLTFSDGLLRPPWAPLTASFRWGATVTFCRGGPLWVPWGPSGPPGPGPLWSLWGPGPPPGAFGGPWGHPGSTYRASLFSARPVRPSPGSPGTPCPHPLGLLWAPLGSCWGSLGSPPGPLRSPWDRAVRPCRAS